MTRLRSLIILFVAMAPLALATVVVPAAPPAPAQLQGDTASVPYTAPATQHVATTPERAEPATRTGPAPVDPRVLSELAASRSGMAAFVAVMRETPGGGPDSAVPGQMGLEVALAFLRDRGSVKGSLAFYGANGIVIRGDRRAVEYLAGWTDVARIEPYQGRAVWRRLMAVASAPAEADATGSITGTVTSDVGATPLSGIKVTAYRLIDPYTQTWSQAGSATTGATGAYSISGLPLEPYPTYRAKFEDPAGNYITEYYNNQWDWKLATNFDIKAGEPTPNINAALAVAGKIAGTITSATNGAAKSGIRTTAWRFLDGAWGNAPEWSAISGTSGAYTIGGLPAGIYRVRFSNPFYPTVPDEPEWYINVPTRDLAVDITVTATMTTTNINAGIGMNGYIDGVVTAFDGATVADIAVTAYQYNPVLTAFQTISQTVTAADGSYLFTLLGGTYRIGFSDPLGQLLPEYYNDKATLEAGTNVPARADGEPTSGIDAVLDAPVTTGNVPLATGWNLIASYLHPVNPTPPAPFAGIAGQYNLVYAYNGCQPAAPWSKYDPTAPPYANNLAAVNVKQGLWLRATAPVTLTITGRPPVGTQIALCTGWNLIGYPAAAARPVAEALAGIAGKYNLVQAYDAADAADPWKEYNPANPGAADLTELAPWRGYWIRMTQAATLTVGNR